MSRTARGLDRRAVARVGARLVGALAGTAALTVVLFYASVHTFAGNSDGATVLLEGVSMSSGHVTLHGWSFTVESFWSIDALFYAAAVRVVGLHPALLHAVPAVIVALVVVLGARLASAGRHGAAAVVAAGTVVVLLGLPSPDLGYFLLQGPWHVGTALWCLCAIAALGRGTWRSWLVAVAFLAAALLGDAMTVTIGFAPLVFTGLVTMRRYRSVLAGARVLGAVAAGIGVAFGARAIAVSVGTFALVNRNVPIAGTQIAWNIRHLASLVTALFGDGALPIGLSPGPFILRVGHLIGVLVVTAAAAAAIADLAHRLVRPLPKLPDARRQMSLEDALLFAFAGDLATFVLASPTTNPNFERYLSPGVIFGAILAGRMVGRLIPRLHMPALRRGAAVGALVVAFTFGLDVATCVASPAPAQPASNLASFLAGHDLTEGIGDYWSSSLVTVESDGAVVVRPVTNNGYGQLLRYDRQSADTWYAGQAFQFFVYNTSRPWRAVDSASATTTFGPPAHTYEVGSYRVLVWSTPVSLSPLLPNQPDPVRLYFRL